MYSGLIMDNGNVTNVDTQHVVCSTCDETCVSMNDSNVTIENNCICFVNLIDRKCFNLSSYSIWNNSEEIFTVNLNFSSIFGSSTKILLTDIL